MFRKNEEVKEEKVESTLLYRSDWGTCIQYAVALADGIHLATISRPLSDRGIPDLMIWNIKHQHLCWHSPIYDEICALASLKNHEFVSADSNGNISRYKLNEQGVPRFIEKFPTNLNEISAMAELEDGSLAIVYENCLSIWNLTEKKEIRSAVIGLTRINTMDTQCDDFLFLGNQSGCIFIYNLKNENYNTYTFSTKEIKSLVLLPDNTIAFLDSDANLVHYDPTIKKTLSSQKVDGEPSLLTAMPNGWIGCINSKTFLLFEPSWIRDYVNANSAEAKNVVAAHLPPDLADIVLAYVGKNITLFNSPKMPNQKENFLPKELPTLKRI